MAEIVKGRGVKVEVGYTEGAAVAISAVSNANPGIASRPSHGLLAGSVGYFDNIEGMDPLDGQAIRVADATPTTAGMPSSRATVPASESMPPPSAMTPQCNARSTPV